MNGGGAMLFYNVHLMKTPEDHFFRTLPAFRYAFQWRLLDEARAEVIAASEWTNAKVLSPVNTYPTPGWTETVRAARATGTLLRLEVRARDVGAGWDVVALSTDLADVDILSFKTFHLPGGARAQGVAYCCGIVVVLKTGAQIELLRNGAVTLIQPDDAAQRSGQRHLA